MSGVAGADRVKSRQDFAQFLASYKELLSQFPGFVSMVPSGSYNSNLEKQDFGDIDLVVHIQSDKDKTALKKEMVAFFAAQPDTTIVPFTSPKYTGKRTYNSGEIVTVRYHDDQLGYSAQIDNIIALDQSEATFKQSFLDLPAEKQGLILGLVKISTIETEPELLFQKLGLKIPAQLEPNQEFEFNLSSIELQLRKVTYEPGSYKQAGREVLWSSRSFDDLKKLLYQYDLDADFDTLLAQIKQTIKNPRSSDRIKGVFSSMITVKSGEVGTAKGAGKEAALAKINQTLSESKFSDYLKHLTEAEENKHVTFCFGRMNPPTIGHAQVFKTMAEQGGDYKIFLSKSQDKKENPLPYNEKIEFVKKIHPDFASHIVEDPSINTALVAASYLYNLGYTAATFVAGSDRIGQFQKLLTQYNGVEGKAHGYYKFDSLDFVSSGDREDGAEGVAGISASGARAAAATGNLEEFARATGAGEYSKELYNAVRQGMGIVDAPAAEGTDWPFAGEKVGQKPGDMWKGTDPGPPGKKAFGGDAEESLELESIKRLAGIGRGSNTINTNNDSGMSGSEKARLMKEHNIQPGTQEWFRLWFSRTFITGKKPIGK